MNHSNKKVSVIGAGFAGLASAAILAKNGMDVSVFEKNEMAGGRARTFDQEGFRFDMGPSWFWMPDVYEKFYQIFGYSTSNFYELKKLDPGFAVIFKDQEVWDIPADFEQICYLFEKIENGAGEKLKQFIKEAEFKYQVGMEDVVYKPFHHFTEFLDLNLFKNALKLQLLTSFSSHTRKYFKDERLLALMEFPVLFLGAMPQQTPALYSLMNYAGLKQGTFYPMGGFGEVANSFLKIAEEQGVKIHFNSPVDTIEIIKNRVVGLQTNGLFKSADVLIGAADYAHVEQKLLPKEYRSYTSSYWESRTFAPSSLLFYLGINKKIEKLRHHNLFFDEQFDQHAIEIYKDKKWPTKPLFYVCCPSKTDASVAPAGHENIFILMPIAIGMEDSEDIREDYFERIMERLEKFAGETIRSNIVYKRSYCVSNFIEDYNAYQGNAYGLANTLQQTAFLKPKLKNNKLKNMYYAGQLTVPGPGVPPSIISGQIAANEILKTFQ